MTDSGIECRTNVPCSLEKGIYFVLFMRSWRREVRGPKLLAKPITVCIPVCACVFVEGESVSYFNCEILGRDEGAKAGIYDFCSAMCPF